MCDGYYWPMSNRATRGKFYDLARRCEDSCNGDAKLFYMPSGRGDVKRMTDLSGRAYEHINTAFLYRKKLVKSCTCKPMPWSYSARAKHMQYAAKEREQRLRLEQQERQRHVALQRPQQDTEFDHVQRSRARKSRRTIVESLDERVSSQAVAEDQLTPTGEDAPLATIDQAPIEDTNRGVRAKRRQKRSVARKRRPRRYGAMKHRRRKQKPKWASGFGGDKPGKVWPGDRPRRR